MTSSSPLSRESEPYVTRSLLAVIFIIWIFTVIANGEGQIASALSQGPTVPQLLILGGNVSDLTINRMQYWRLVSSCFLHMGVLHIAFNSWALAVFGPGLERALGKGRFLLVFVLSGIGGEYLSARMNPGVVSAGASGAIFGLIGALWSVLLRRKASSAAVQQIIWIVGLNFAWGLRPGSHIDNWAHGGGLIAGFVLGYALSGDGDPRAALHRAFDSLCGILAAILVMYGLGSAGANAWTLLLHPESSSLQDAISASGDYAIGVPVNWSHAVGKGWDIWNNSNRSALMSRRVPQDFAQDADTLNGAVKLTKDLMSGLLGESNPDELSVVSRESRKIGESPAFRIMCFTRLKDESSFRLTAFWMKREGGYYVVALLTPVEISWPDDWLARIAGSIRPIK